jgi:hypothetical protein
MACNPGSDTSQDSQPQGIINKGYAWPGGRVEVCFLNAQEAATAGQIVQKAVTSNFRKDTTGIEFFGFGPCAADSQAQARVLFEKPVPGSFGYSNYIGKLRVSESSPNGETIALPGLESPLNTIKLYNTTLHEFGHFAGLFHEHHHSKNADGALCTRATGGEIVTTDHMQKFARWEPTEQNRMYDHMSVMNYCVPGGLTQFLQLSPGDIWALRALYMPGADAGDPSSALPNVQVPTPAGSETNVAQVCNIFEILPPETAETLIGIPKHLTHTTDGWHVSAFMDATLSAEKVIGHLPVGALVTRTFSTTLQHVVIKNGEHYSAMQVIPQSGPLAGQTVWILGNVTRVVDCRPE